MSRARARTSVKVEINSAGIAQMLRSSGIQAKVYSVASSIHSNIADTLLQTHSHLEKYEARGGRLKSSREAVAVFVKHPAAMPKEAKHATISKAVASAGHKLVSRG